MQITGYLRNRQRALKLKLSKPRMQDKPTPVQLGVQLEAEAAGIWRGAPVVTVRYQMAARPRIPVQLAPSWEATLRGVSSAQVLAEVIAKRPRAWTLEPLRVSAPVVGRLGPRR